MSTRGSGGAAGSFSPEALTAAAGCRKRTDAGVDIADGSRIRRAEGIDAGGVGLLHPPRTVNDVVEHHQHAAAARLRRGGDLHRLIEIGGAIGADRRRRAHRADQHHRHVGGKNRLQEEAVSSMVSVPWVITIPSASLLSIAVLMRATRSNQTLSFMSCDPIEAICSAVICATLSRPGTAAARFAPLTLPES